MMCCWFTREITGRGCVVGSPERLRVCRGCVVGSPERLRVGR